MSLDRGRKSECQEKTHGDTDLMVEHTVNELELLPVSYSKVLLLFQGVDKCDQEVLVVEKSGEHGDALLNVGLCCVGGLMTDG